MDNLDPESGANRGFCYVPVYIFTGVGTYGAAVYGLVQCG